MRDDSDVPTRGTGCLLCGSQAIGDELFGGRHHLFPRAFFHLRGAVRAQTFGQSVERAPKKLGRL